MTPAPGTRIRLVRLVGVASDEMRAHVGRVGVVARGLTLRDGSETVAVRFGAAPEDPTFWLKPGEYEVVA